MIEMTKDNAHISASLSWVEKAFDAFQLYIFAQYYDTRAEQPGALECRTPNRNRYAI